MNISICITVLNEESSIGALLDSLINQSKKAKEIIVVDGGSDDSTLDIINHYQKRYGGIKLLKETCNRAKGRNLAVEVAKSEIIAMTDAGCIADRDWLKNLVLPFETNIVDVSCGFYKMRAKNDFQKAESFFIGVTPARFDVNFLPSTRSIAFTKKIWEEVGGFPKSQKGAAEDTIFNFRLIKSKAKFARVKNAVVEWGMPESLTAFFEKVRDYAKGDIKSKIWIFPGKGITSHNIKALFVVLRYLLGIILMVISIKYRYLLPFLVIGIFCYLILAFRKVYLEFGEIGISIFGPILQLTSDFAIISGIVASIFGL